MTGKQVHFWHCEKKQHQLNDQLLDFPPSLRLDLDPDTRLL